MKLFKHNEQERNEQKTESIVKINNGFSEKIFPKIGFFHPNFFCYEKCFIARRLPLYPPIEAYPLPWPIVQVANPGTLDRAKRARYHQSNYTPPLYQPTPRARRALGENTKNPILGHK